MTTFLRMLLVISGGALAMLSCKRDDTQITGPGITQRIHEFEGYACSGGTVTRYDFQNTEVFLFAQACPVSDEAFPIYDLDGNAICWIGGFGGTGDCRGVQFSREARNPTVIYTKP